MAAARSLITTYGPDSPFAEAYRYLRTSLVLPNGGPPPRVLAVVAARPGTGASTTAANLAIAMVEVSRKVLLVDADLRRPALARLLGVKPEPGLAEVLAGQVVLSRAVQATPVEGLWLLTAGKPHRRALADLELGFPALVAAMREAFDFVVVDTPAAALFPDALLIAPHVDGVALVARAQEPRSPAFDDVRRRLEQGHAPVLGVVFNHVHPEDDEVLRYYREYATAR